LTWSIFELLEYVLMFHVFTFEDTICLQLWYTDHQGTCLILGPSESGCFSWSLYFYFHFLIRCFFSRMEFHFYLLLRKLPWQWERGFQSVHSFYSGSCSGKRGFQSGSSQSSKMPSAGICTLFCFLLGISLSLSTQRAVLAIVNGVSIWVQSIFQDAICWYLYFPSSFSHSSKPASVLIFFSWSFHFHFLLAKCGFNLSPVNLPGCHLLVSVLLFFSLVISLSTYKAALAIGKGVSI